MLLWEKAATEEHSPMSVPLPFPQRSAGPAQTANATWERGEAGWTGHMCASHAIWGPHNRAIFIDI